MEDRSAFAIVRPPGHHADRKTAMGFCYLNNVAAAAQALLNDKESGIERILIVDWDIHHGNGTQQIFENSKNVLYFSVHRYDSGEFYPGPLVKDGDMSHIGVDGAEGYNINVPWEGIGYGDADYAAVWDRILLPVAETFKPDIILISAGFDSAEGDKVGECNVTPDGYAVLLNKLKSVTNGKFVLALEGGYELKVVGDCVVECVKALLGDVSSTHVAGDPKPETLELIQQVCEMHCNHWPLLQLEEQSLSKRTSTTPHLVSTVAVESGPQKTTKIVVGGDSGNRVLSKNMEQSLPKRTSTTQHLVSTVAVESGPQKTAKIVVGGDSGNRVRSKNMVYDPSLNVQMEEMNAGEGKRRTSLSKRAGLEFSVSRIRRHLKVCVPRKNRIAKSAAVYSTAVLEYLTAELLEVAGNQCKDDKRKHIKPRHILLAIKNDEELDTLTSATIAGGGVLPHIHKSLEKPLKA